jgi:hypothetical protein
MIVMRSTSPANANGYSHDAGDDEKEGSMVSREYVYSSSRCYRLRLHGLLGDRVS